MNYLIVLSGGTGTRMGSKVPKQYQDVSGVPVIGYTLKNVEHALFEKIVVVVASSWSAYVQKEVLAKFDKNKYILAAAGVSRQESILNGLLALEGIASDDDIVVIHDAARPNCRKDFFSTLIDECQEADGVMPVLPVKDTIYVCQKGERLITGLLNRDELFIGQSPEAYTFGRYLSINKRLTKEQLEIIRGSSEVAYKYGLKIKLIEGDEMNFKITTLSDLEKFVAIIRRKV